MREWTGLEFDKSQKAVEKEKNEETGSKVICGANIDPCGQGIGDGDGEV